MSIGSKLKNLREIKGWSQSTLAARSGVKRSYISLLEIGAIKSPGAQPILKLARVLDVDQAYLIEDDDRISNSEASEFNHSEDFDDFVLYLQGRNPDTETLQKLKKIAEMLLPEKPHNYKD